MNFFQDNNNMHLPVQNVQAAPEPTGLDMEYMPGFQTQHSDTLIRWQLMFSDILDEVEHRLKGEFLRVRGNNSFWEEKPGARMCNDKGVFAIMQVLSTYMNKGTILSSFNREEADRMIYQTMSSVIDLIELKYQIYEIDKANLSTLMSFLEGYITCAVYRAKDGTTLKFLKTTEKHSETYTNQDANKKQSGWLSYFAGI